MARVHLSSDTVHVATKEDGGLVYLRMSDGSATTQVQLTPEAAHLLGDALIQGAEAIDPFFKTQIGPSLWD